jgi:RHS repeat-associated protein
VAEYSYDSMNRRFRKVVSNNGIDGNATNGTTEYFYKDWQAIEEQDGSDSALRQYVYGRYIDEPLTLDDRSGGQTVADLNDGSGDDRLFYHCNTQYSTFALTDEAGSIVEGYQYDAYGRQTVITDPGSDGSWFTDDDDTLTVDGNSAVDNPYMFQGRRFDGETELHFYRNRYYNSRLGRFISRDPMGVWYDVQGYGNGYLFASNSPHNLSDAFGNRALPPGAQPLGPGPYGGAGSTNAPSPRAGRHGYGERIRRTNGNVGNETDSNQSGVEGRMGRSSSSHSYRCCMDWKQKWQIDGFDHPFGCANAITGASTLGSVAQGTVALGAAAAAAGAAKLSGAAASGAYGAAIGGAFLIGDAIGWSWAIDTCLQSYCIESTPSSCEVYNAGYVINTLKYTCDKGDIFHTSNEPFDFQNKPTGTVEYEWSTECC